MIEKLVELKKRADNLRYNDKNELDDIKRKTKMYLGQAFPAKFTYASEVDYIKFSPTITYGGMGDKPYQDSWAKGKQELVNLLDTRIEELNLEKSKVPSSQPKTQIVEKIVEVKVQDTTKINILTNRIMELTNEIDTLRSKQSFWKRLNWVALIGIIISLLGGAFFLGKYFGENRFDNEKINLVESNKQLSSKVDSLQKILSTQNLPSETQLKQKPSQDNSEGKEKLNVNISFLEPTSIFDGKILIIAKHKYSDVILLTFKGADGLSKSLQGKFDSLELEIQKGDRFYFKDTEGQIWITNVISSEVNANLEIIRKK